MIPDNDPMWDYAERNSEHVQSRWDTLKEKKSRTGDRRHCKWCGKYKPDRCHHCRVCKQCILRMDHHCPWIMNCVGYHNYKYFFLLVWYSALDCVYIAASMLTSVHKAVNEETQFA